MITRRGLFAALALLPLVRLPKPHVCKFVRDPNRFQCRCKCGVIRDVDVFQTYGSVPLVVTKGQSANWMEVIQRETNAKVEIMYGNGAPANEYYERILREYFEPAMEDVAKKERALFDRFGE